MNRLPITPPIATSEPTGRFVSNPTVSIAIPALNEESHIEKVIRGFQASDYPELLEILVADGGSSDRTVHIVAQISASDKRVKLLHNPKRIQSEGLNIMLNAACGDIFLRADAHCDYSIDYISMCVEALRNSRATNVGGAQRFVAKNSVQLGIALASTTWLGSGGAKYRRGDYEGYADTVFLGCFWRDRLLQLRGFACDNGTNEDSELNLRGVQVFGASQITNQDAELNNRLNASWPYAVFVSPKIRVWYYPRQNWLALFKQYFRYGRGRCLTTVKHGWRKSLRGVLPFLALLLFCLAAAIATVARTHYLLFFLLITPVLGICIVSVTACFRQAPRLPEIWRGDPAHLPSLIHRLSSCAMAISTMLPAHALGFGYQLIWRFGIRRKTGW